MDGQGLAEPEDEGGQFAEDPDEQHRAEQRGQVPVAGCASGEALCHAIEGAADEHHDTVVSADDAAMSPAYENAKKIGPVVEYGRLLTRLSQRFPKLSDPG